MIENRHIGIIGAGNIAHLMVHRLHKHYTCHLWNRTAMHAHALQQKFHSVHVHENILELLNRCDVLLLCVSDHAIDAIMDKCKDFPDKIYIHNSGSLVTQPRADFEHMGCIWPVYSIISDKVNDYKHDLPIIYNATDDQTMVVVRELAEIVSHQVVQLNDEQKSVAHLLAVMTNNFIHHLMYKSQALSSKHGIPFDLFTPIIHQTIDQLKFDSETLKALQTGPARRQDKNTISRHLKIIEDDSNLSSIYHTITQSIINLYTNE